MEKRLPCLRIQRRILSNESAHRKDTPASEPSWKWRLPSTPKGDAGFSALELPDIIGEIVDDLQPILTAYDAAFYWFLFRHSIAKDGNPQIRVSRSSLRRAVVKSSYTNAAENNISIGKVQDTLHALEEIGAIQKLGEPNRQGTLYRVLIPDEIEACRKFRAERLAEEPALFPLRTRASTKSACKSSSATATSASAARSSSHASRRRRIM